MSCSCDENPPSAFWQETRRARKAHTCRECAGPINPGDSYRHVRGVWDCEPDTIKTCSACLKLEAWVVEVGACRPCLGDVIEDAQQELCYMGGPWSEIRRQWWQGARLYVQARQRQSKAWVARRLAKAKAAAALQEAP
jgi:DICT domain-containing protein